MVDGDVWWGDQHRLGVRESVVTVLAIIVAHAGRAGSAERHRLDEQMDVHLIHGAAAVRQFANEPVDRLLRATENKRSQRAWGRCDVAECFVERFIRKNWQDRPKNL